MTKLPPHLLDELDRARRAPRTRPFVTLAFARSADGCLARARGERLQLSGPESSRLTHALRANHEALAIGVETALADDPLLTTRLVTGPSPLRIVVDTNLRTPATARLVSAAPAGALLACGPDAPASRQRRLEQSGAEIVRGPVDSAGVRLPGFLATLWRRGVRSLMVEGGARLLASFVRERLFDFVCVTIAPVEVDGPNAVRLSGRDPLDLATERTHSMQLGCDTVVGGMAS